MALNRAVADRFGLSRGDGWLRLRLIERIERIGWCGNAGFRIRNGWFPVERRAQLGSAAAGGVLSWSAIVAPYVKSGSTVSGAGSSIVSIDGVKLRALCKS